MTFRLFLIVNIISSPLFASQWKLEILTFSSGPELYSSWGHNAIRVTEPNKRQYLFDYGTFQYDETFLFKFLAGTPKYWLAKSDWRIREFISKKRGVSIWSHNILLSQSQIASIAGSLDVLSLSKTDKFYDYDALNNNCTTKIRDLLVDNLGAKIFSPLEDYDEGLESYRSIHEKIIPGSIFFHLGILTLFNHDVEINISRAQQSYLPNMFYQELEGAAVKFPETVQPGRQIMQAAKNSKSKLSWQIPTMLFLIVLLLLFQSCSWGLVIYTLLGGIRCILSFILLLFFFSQWEYFSMNPALLLYNPIPLLSLFPRFKKVCLYILMVSGATLLLLSIGKVSPDRFFLYLLVYGFDLLAYAKAREDFI